MVDSGSFKTSSFLQESKYLSDLKEVANQPSSDKDSVRRQIDPSVDLERLDVCFGGFSPMALSDGVASAEQVEAAIQREKARVAAAEHAAAVEAARASEPANFEDASGNVWTYVVLDGSEVRIERCQCEEAALVIPESIDGKPVVSLAAEACSALELAESIDMPDTVVSIGYCAFRGCDNLKRIRFSYSLAKFDSGWLRACRRLEELTLPGQLEKLTASIFDTPDLKSLHIGPALADVASGAFAKSQLDVVTIDPVNALLATDGRAIYSKDGSVMYALAVPCTEYDVREGCKVISRKAFSNFKELQKITLPEGVGAIEPFAFAQTGITSFNAPSTLKLIGERAFFGCSNLEEVTLNDGLAVIESNAFSDTALTSLRIPDTVTELGYPIASGTSLTYSGEDATFSIVSNSAQAQSQRLVLDEKGGLYLKDEKGMHLVRMLEPNLTSYEVMVGTTDIGEGAFAKHATLSEVVIPEGVTFIGNGAFKDCKALVSVTLPNSISELGEEAFLGTNIESLFIPKGLARIGAIALITEGAHHGMMEPSLRHIEVEEGNPRYRMEQGLLIDRLDNGSDRILLCTGEEPDVDIPESVTGIAQYAFNGVRRLRNLSISERIQMIDVRGIAFDCLPEKIHVDLEEPKESHSSFDFFFPNTSRAAQQLRLAFGSCTHIDVTSIFDHYDNSIVSRSGFDAESEGQLGAYEQGRRVVERLLDPVCMTPNNRSLMDTSMRNHLLEICVDAARHDDKAIMDGLIELGFIDSDNISEVIEVVSAIKDASVTNYLLEQKQRRFGSQGIDFDL